jgi:hypothetical protein
MTQFARPYKCFHQALFLWGDQGCFGFQFYDPQQRFQGDIGKLTGPY